MSDLPRVSRDKAQRKSIDPGRAVAMLKEIQRAEDTLRVLQGYLIHEGAFPKGAKGARMFNRLSNVLSTLDDAWFYVGDTADLGERGFKMLMSRMGRGG